MWQLLRVQARQLFGPGLLTILILQALLTLIDRLALIECSLSGGALLRGALWLPVTSGLIVPSAPFLSLILLLLFAYIFVIRPLERQLPFQLSQLVWFAGAALLAVELVGLFFPAGMIRGLLLNGLYLFFFARALERRWGRRRFIHFALLATTLSQLATLPWLFNHPEIVMPASTVGLDRALLYAWCVSQGRYIYFPQPLKTRVIIWILIAWCVLDLISTPMPIALLPLAGVGAAALLISGSWSPKVARAKLKRAQARFQRARTRH